LLKGESLLSLLCYVIPALRVRKHKTMALSLSDTVLTAIEGYTNLIEQLRGALECDKHDSAGKLWNKIVSGARASKFDPSSLNSYAVDFLAHGNIQQLTQQNGLPDSKAYHLIETCNSLLSKIALALQQCMGPDTSPIAAAFTKLADAFGHKF